MSTNERPQVHFIGICGKAMGPIAAALARAGWRVTGSDEDQYPPMSDYLAQCGITISLPAKPGEPLPEADLFVVGKRMREDHSELAQVIAQGRRYLSFPAFLREYFLANSQNAVVAGGVGKTTTSAMLTWILEYAGLQPDYLIGGLTGNLEHPARFAGSSVAVMEGDEYASCFDDARPKFMHYAADVAVVTNLIEDHPDLFDGPEALFTVFAEWVHTLPPSGCLVLPEHDAAALRLAEHAACRVEVVGTTDTASRRIEALELGDDGSRFRLDGCEVTLAMYGHMNVRNAAAAMVAASHMGIEPAIAAAALAEFRGVGNRQQWLEIGECAVVLDKASHPASLQGLFQAVRQKFPQRRLVSLIQPRATGGRGWVYQRDLPAALVAADLVLLARPYEHRPRPGQTWAGGPFSVDALAQELRDRRVAVDMIDDVNEPAAALRAYLRAGDVLVVTLPEQALAARAAVLSAVESWGAS